VIAGAHAIVFAEDAEAAQEFMRDVLGLESVDAGDGWLIFGLPPADRTSSRTPDRLERVAHVVLGVVEVP